MVEHIEQSPDMMLKSLNKQKNDILITLNMYPPNIYSNKDKAFNY